MVRRLLSSVNINIVHKHFLKKYKINNLNRFHNSEINELYVMIKVVYTIDIFSQIFLKHEMYKNILQYENVKT